MEKYSQPRLDAQTVRASYKRWAPIYDWSFGVISFPGRQMALSRLNHRDGRILEIGVGTGLSLPRYKKSLQIMGIDLSPSMLHRAGSRIQTRALKTVNLAVMDAGYLAFADSTFDAIAAMYVMTVVPDPARVLAEVHRVLKPGGVVVIVNHFSQENGVRGRIEREMARYSRHLGWHPVFPLEIVTRAPGFHVKEIKSVPPGGLFTLLQLERIPS